MVLIKKLMRVKYISEGYTKVYNVDPRGQSLKINIDICGPSGFDLVLDNCCYEAYISPSMIGYLRIP